jgi:L-fucose isomerase-like protein
LSLKLSINGLYLYNEEKIYFVNESKSYDLDDVSFNQWVDIFKENTRIQKEKLESEKVLLQQLEAAEKQVEEDKIKQIINECNNQFNSFTNKCSCRICDVTFFALNRFPS